MNWIISYIRRKWENTDKVSTLIGYPSSCEIYNKVVRINEKIMVRELMSYGEVEGKWKGKEVILVISTIVGEYGD